MAFFRCFDEPMRCFDYVPNKYQTFRLDVHFIKNKACTMVRTMQDEYISRKIHLGILKLNFDTMLHVYQGVLKC